MVRDTSYTTMQRINLDLSSQVNPRHLVKAGAKLDLSHLVEDCERINETIWTYGPFCSYDVKPLRFAVYMQDQIEYGGMIGTSVLSGARYSSQTMPTPWFVPEAMINLRHWLA